MTEPVFLFSLPRSGSTLVQRLIAGHPQVATTSEPWILLPLLYTLRRPGAYTEYGHRVAVRAIEDFTGQMHGGRDEYLFELREFATGALRRAAGHGERYFLDKTPRYHLIIHEIMELFPEGKFDLPVAAAAGRGRLDRRVVRAAASGTSTSTRSTSRTASTTWSPPRVRTTPGASACATRTCVADTDSELARVFEFLGLDPSEAEGMSDDALRGRMRDRTGVADLRRPSAPSRWTSGGDDGDGAAAALVPALPRPPRPARLETMGYDHDDLVRQVAQLPARPRDLVSDVARRAYGSAQQRSARRLILPSSKELAKQAEARQAQMS